MLNFLIFFLKFKKKGLNFEKGPSFFLTVKKKGSQKGQSHPSSCSIFFLTAPWRKERKNSKVTLSHVFLILVGLSTFLSFDLIDLL
jgi:hypothetical protein